MANDEVSSLGAGSSKRPGVHESAFRFHSFGTVARNKAIGDPVCEVVPLETSSFIDGEITDNGTTLNIDMTTSTGRNVSTKAVVSAPIPATWVGMGESNRISPPDVRRGEEVIIFTYGDTGKYYWTPRNTNRWTRKLETVKFAFSGTTDESDETVTPENHYWMEFSTHKKHITLSTSSANGELCRWFIEMRGKDGKFVVANDKGEEILIDGVVGHIRAINRFDTEVALLKKDINFYAPGNLTGKVDGVSNITIIGDSNLYVTGNTYLKTPAYTVEAALTTFKGNVAIDGNFNCSQNGEFAGALKAKMANFPDGHGPH